MYFWIDLLLGILIGFLAPANLLGLFAERVSSTSQPGWASRSPRLS